jgi:hypothetical protein
MHTPHGIAIDEKTQTLYWADFGAGAIDRASAAPSAPERYAEFVNSADPFGRTRRIHYQLPRTSRVGLEVFDPCGRVALTRRSRPCRQGDIIIGT